MQSFKATLILLSEGSGTRQKEKLSSVPFDGLKSIKKLGLHLAEKPFNLVM